VYVIFCLTYLKLSSSMKTTTLTLAFFVFCLLTKTLTVDCDPTLIGCLTCKTDVMVCDACDPDKNFADTPVENKCICVDGDYLIKDQAKCDACNVALPNCNKCLANDDLTAKCTACNDPYYVKGDVCEKCTTH